jgi:phosphoribosylamine-glycine ligase
MVVVGPEDPLVKGFMTSFKRCHYLIFQLLVRQNGCATRGKEFAKEFLIKHHKQQL